MTGEDKYCNLTLKVMKISDEGLGLITTSSMRPAKVVSEDEWEEAEQWRKEPMSINWALSVATAWEL